MFSWLDESLKSMKLFKISIGRGNTYNLKNLSFTFIIIFKSIQILPIVEFFSPAILFSVCKYLSCIAWLDWLNISAASFKAPAALCSPSAAIT